MPIQMYYGTVPIQYPHSGTHSYNVHVLYYVHLHFNSTDLFPHSFFQWGQSPWTFMSIALVASLSQPKSRPLRGGGGRRPFALLFSFPLMTTRRSPIHAERERKREGGGKAYFYLTERERERELAFLFWSRSSPSLPLSLFSLVLYLLVRVCS